MRAALITLALGALLLAPAAAAAGPAADPKFAARALAEHGFALFEAGKYAEAIDVLQQAERLYHAPTLLLALARAHVAAGKLVEARELFQRVAAEQLPASAPQAFRDAQRSAGDEIAALDRRIPTLQIVLRGGGGGGLRVRVDEIDVPGWSAERPLPENPGLHRVTVVPLGGVGVSRTVELKDGARERVDLELPGAGPALVAPPVAPAPGSSTAPPSGRPWLVPSLMGFGLGALGLGVGVGAGVSAGDRAAAIRKACGGTTCPATEQAALSSAKGVAAASTVGFVLAGVGAATGVVLLVVRPGGRSAPPRAALVVGPGSLGVVGAFR